MLLDGRILEGRSRFEEASRAYRQAATLGGDDPHLLWRVSARLGWIAHATGQRQAAAAQFEKALGIVERIRTQTGAPHRLSIQTRVIDLHYQYADVLLSHGQIEQALSIADSGRARVLAERHGVDAPARRSPAAFREVARRVGGVVLFYWFSQSKSYAWVVTAQNIRLVTLPATESEIDALVRDYRR